MGDSEDVTLLSKSEQPEHIAKILDDEEASCEDCVQWLLKHLPNVPAAAAASVMVSSEAVAKEIKISKQKVSLVASNPFNRGQDRRRS